ncbi:MAG: hypothetical protein ACI8TX_002040 [Hyphomicrobiaceae bacterium]
MPEYFAHIYLLVFAKIAVGGLLSLSIPPFAQMERGFYKSTAAVYLLAAIATAGGELTLASGTGPFSPSGIEITLWSAFAAVFAVYWVSLYVKRPRLRALSYPAALVVGLVALATSAWQLAPQVSTPLAGLIPTVWAFAGAAVLGAGASGMLLGHWYLIDTGLDLAPLLRMTRFYRRALIWQIGAVTGCVAAAWLLPGQAWSSGFDSVTELLPAWLVVGRITGWGLAVMLGALISRTLAIPQTMAATGLFYIAALVVCVGEIIAHWLMFRTGLFL